MRAMVLPRPAKAGERPLVPADLPTPVPGPREILVEVSACGVCRTDLHTVEGDLPLPRLPVVPGHQVVGRVAALGPGASRHRIGDRVGIGWLHGVCGTCARCGGGRENLCADARFTGLHADGGYAEFCTVGEDFAFPLPAGIPDHDAAPLLCAGIIGYRALRACGARPGEPLGLFGFGASAHLTLQVAVHEGVPAFVFTRGAEHRRLALALGAAWAGGAEDEPPRPLAAAISFAPSGPLVPRILALLDRGATLALAGVTMTEIPALSYDRLLYHERRLASVANYTRRDAAEFLALAAAIPVRTEVEVFPLAAANEALLALSESRLRAAAVLRLRN